MLASTDCGLARGPQLQRVPPTIQRAKLDALAASARTASGNLSLAGAHT